MRHNWPRNPSGSLAPNRQALCATKMAGRDEWIGTRVESIRTLLGLAEDRGSRGPFRQGSGCARDCNEQLNWRVPGATDTGR